MLEPGHAGVRPVLELGQKRSQIKWGASSNGEPGQTRTQDKRGAKLFAESKHSNRGIQVRLMKPSSIVYGAQIHPVRDLFVDKFAVADSRYNGFVSVCKNLRVTSRYSKCGISAIYKDLREVERNHAQIIKLSNAN
jgi:hypothetical protein